ncbi:phytanoyl-CoA dioxygenase family protein [Nocardioides sp. NPDC006303]|uniref:phytanoyl-CoA dioxygenase family protein n=1 Tax=Nocardioides sp. NPDC006303 TaxID=3156747 RepID=UPI0033BFAA9C
MKGMTMVGLTTLPNTASVDDVVAIIERDGGVIVEDLFGGNVLEGLQRDIELAINSVPEGVDAEFAGTKTRRAGALFARSEHMIDVATNPIYQGAARAILQKPLHVFFGEERTEITPQIQIGTTQAIHIQPGQGAQVLHRDDTVWMWRHPDYGREARVQIMVAITDFTHENGGTQVIPGSHKWDDDRAPKVSEAVSTEMKAGSALIWIGSTYHGGGNNTSDGPRTGLTMAFDLAFLRQEENQYLSIPLEKVKSFPEDVQRLLGWESGESFLGFVEKDGQMTDPMDILNSAEYEEIGRIPGRV